MDELIKKSDALDAIGECPYSWTDTEAEIQAADDWRYYKSSIEAIPAIEPNLILPKRMERGEVYDVGETITVMNHEDYMDMMCKAMMWDEYGKEPTMNRNDKWNVSINNIIPFKSEPSIGVIIEWSGNIGFGEYTIYQKNNKWYGESEHMDRGEDKEFLKHLLNSFAESVEIIE